MTSADANGKPLSEKIEDLLENSEVDEGRKEELLQAMLGVARGITNGTNGTAVDLQKDFDEAFEGLTADKVGMLLSYRDGMPGMIVGHPELPQAVWTNGQSAEPAVHRILSPRIFPKPKKK